MTDRIWNVAVYARLSSDDGDKAESNSITSQKEIIRDYVAKHPEFVIAEEYVDDGFSGVNFERPGFKKMLEDIQAKKVDCIICKDLSRFARNYIDAGRYLEKIFPYIGIRFIAINDNYDSEGERAQADALIVPFKNLINDAYCRDISVKIRSQLDIKRKMGDYIGAFAPYGYKKDPQNKNKLLVDDPAARIVEIIFSLRIQGMCNAAIANKLNALGVPTPMDYKHSQGLNYQCSFDKGEKLEWRPLTVHRILTNEVYIGTLIQHKTGTPNHKVKKRVEYDRYDWFIVENNHEPIIRRTDFYTVQNLMQRNVRTSPKEEMLHLFSGFVFCGDCKNTMTRYSVPRGEKTYCYMVCSTNRSGEGCTSHSFSVSKLEQVVFHLINDQIALVAQVEKLLNFIATLPEQNRHVINYDVQISAVEAEIAHYHDLKLRLHGDMTDGIISREEFLEFDAGYKRKIDEREKKIAKLKEDRSRALENDSGCIEWIAEFKRYQHLKKLDRECIVHLIDRILIYEGKRVEIYFRYRDEMEAALQYIERFEDIIPDGKGKEILERRQT